jgi:hypothetical protein
VVNRLAVRQRLRKRKIAEIPNDIALLAPLTCGHACCSLYVGSMRTSGRHSGSSEHDEFSAALQSGGAGSLICSHCAYPLECVEQNRRAGSWLGSLLCPNCRNEYLYAYRWGRLMRKN